MATHIVRQGETIVGLAKRYRIPKDKILEHPDNRALSDRNRATGILRAGDRVTIPDVETKTISAATERLHRFRCLGRNTLLRVRFMQNEEARANEPYVLRIGLRETRGSLDGDGWLQERIPADAREAVVKLGENADEEVRLRIGNLDPISEVSGLKQRLNNLGYAAGGEDDAHSDALREALRSFQAAHGLEETGELDEPTRNELRNAYEQ